MNLLYNAFYSLKYKIIEDINNLQDKKQKVFLNKVFKSVFNKIIYNDLRTITSLEELKSSIENALKLNIIEKDNYGNLVLKKKFNYLENDQISSRIRIWLKLLNVKIDHLYLKNEYINIQDDDIIDNDYYVFEDNFWVSHPIASGA